MTGISRSLASPARWGACAGLAILLFSGCKNAASQAAGVAAMARQDGAAAAQAAATAGRQLVLSVLDAHERSGDDLRLSMSRYAGTRHFRNEGLQSARRSMSARNAGFLDGRARMVSVDMVAARERMRRGGRPGFAGSLRRATGQEDPSRPSPVASRPLPEQPVLGKLLPGFVEPDSQ